MQAGLLRQRITIQQMTAGDDGQGGTTRTPSTLVANLPAEIAPFGRNPGVERFAIGGTVAELSTIVTIRYRSDVSVRDRIVWGSRTLEIATISDPDGRRRALDLICTEVQA
jgi:SPP1 family predicted phage head-tail adaptor